jgi:hypothetical protein
MKPSTDPKADELRNKNLNQNLDEMKKEPVPVESSSKDVKNNQNGRSSLDYAKN